MPERVRADQLHGLPLPARRRRPRRVRQQRDGTALRLLLEFDGGRRARAVPRHVRLPPRLRGAVRRHHGGAQLDDRPLRVPARVRRQLLGAVPRRLRRALRPDLLDDAGGPHPARRQRDGRLLRAHVPHVCASLPRRDHSQRDGQHVALPAGAAAARAAHARSRGRRDTLQLLAARLHRRAAVQLHGDPDGDGARAAARRQHHVRAHPAQRDDRELHELPDQPLNRLHVRLPRRGLPHLPPGHGPVRPVRADVRGQPDVCAGAARRRPHARGVQEAAAAHAAPERQDGRGVARAQAARARRLQHELRVQD
mmetsp:Transcript_56413/g.155043  ORF Transcript_56413/g.155043 Transcript_56413/m.155043 type:complete len:310 (+) Transcript_56413:4485-5414(+)